MHRTTRRILLLLLATGVVMGAWASAGGTDADADMVDVSLPYTGEEVVYTFFAEGAEDHGEIEQAKATWLAFQEKLGNVRFEHHGATNEEEDTRLALMYASGLEFDLIRVREPARSIPPIADSGILLNFAEYYEYMPNHAVAAAQHPILDYMVDQDGNRHVLTGAVTKDRPYLLTIANTTRFAQDGISHKIETSDEWLDVIAEMEAKDPSITSVYDLWSGTSNLLWTLGGMFNAGRGVQYIGYDHDMGKWYYGPMDPDHGFKETLMWMNEVYEMGGLHPEWLTHTLDQILEVIQSGNWGVGDLYAFGFRRAEPQGYRVNEDDYDVEYFPIPRGPTGAAEAMGGVMFDGAPYWGLSADVDVEKPELLAAALDMFYSPEGQTIFNWGVEGVTYQDDAAGRRRFLPGFPAGDTPDGDLVFTDYFSGFGMLEPLKVIELTVEYTKAHSDFSLGLIRQWADALADGTLTGARVYWGGDQPLLTAEESERVGEEMTAIQTHVDEHIAKFVNGDRSFDEWDDFQAELRSLGDIDYVLDLYASKPVPVYYERDWANYFPD